MAKPTTGIPELDSLIGGVLDGDNIVWEGGVGASLDYFVSRFVAASMEEGSILVYVSFNRSPQAVVSRLADVMAEGRLILVDGFSSGLGNRDEMFLEFFKTTAGAEAHGPIHLENPGDPSDLEQALVEIGGRPTRPARYIFDSLTGMMGLWKNEEKVVGFFGHICPRLYDLQTIAYWLLEKEAHSGVFLAQIHHITQVVIEAGLVQGTPTLMVKKAQNRACAALGVPQRFSLEGEQILLRTESREDRELSLLNRMSVALGSALEPNAFFEQVVEALATELGMVRGTLVLLDLATNRLRIAAAHGLSPEERSRGEYSIGEGVTGRVVETGQPQVVPDIRKDPRFLDRTSARRGDPQPLSFICVPLKVDDEVVGALSADRPFGVETTLEKDLRLLSIVATIVSQVLKINRIVRLEKEEILARDEKLLEVIRSQYRLDRVVGQSRPIQRMLATAAVAARSRATVLITGETGTGKELVANIVHYNSERAGGPLVKVNCGALPETLLESELFGHVRGAFTGAVKDRKGRFELAHGGTLFLDEIAEMSPRLQVKLLRVLQEMEFEPVGSARTVRVDVRVVAATNRDLRQEIRNGRFREDLYYRLNVIPIQLPPLRQRREDIPLLVDHFLDVFNRQYGKSVTKLSRGVLDLLLVYPWPGNVRELENCIERAVVLGPSDTLSIDLLPEEIVSFRERPAAAASPPPSDRMAEIRRRTEELCRASGDLADVREKLLQLVESTIFRQALASGMSQRELARKLSLSRITLRKRLREYGLL